MNEAAVVIGAGYGDEGKGLVTDYLSNQAGKALVVRFNGGAQAAHTVVTPDGNRHVFQHFGSGSFTGATTFLSRFFIVNPITFLREYKELQKLGLSPKVIIDPRCIVTNPYDMMLNQAVEKARGSGRHGSCGLGINETVHRCQKWETRFEDLYNGRYRLRDHLDFLRSYYVEKRKKELGLTADIEFLFDNRILDRYLDEVEEMLTLVSANSWEIDLGWSGPVIFEGAQGLQLDMDSPKFPHVTRSKTGLENALTLAKEVGIQKLDAYYVTRTYTTRHGAGPLEHEISGLPYPKVKDETNIPNAHQGTLRFGWLEPEVTTALIQRDLATAKGFMISPRLVMTCADQIDDEIVSFMKNGKLEGASIYQFLNELSTSIGSHGSLLSWGQKRTDIWVK